MFNFYKFGNVNSWSFKNIQEKENANFGRKWPFNGIFNLTLRSYFSYE